MLNVIGTLAVLLVAVLAVAQAHGADMNMEQRMVEIGLGAKLVALVTKYPLIFASIIGGFLGSCIVTAYQKKDRLKQFLINLCIAVVLTPVVFTLTGLPPTLDRWIAVALAMGLFSGLVLKMIISPEVQDAFKSALVHQINERLGSGDDEKVEEKAE